MESNRNSSRDYSGWVTYKTINLFWIVILFISAGVNSYHTWIDTENLARAQARAMFDYIVLTRSWNAGHGGVYVPETPRTPSNPYLDDPLKDVVTRQGQKLTKINPAYMTRQISEMVALKGGVQFHITSLKPIRPQNAPSEWEHFALQGFEQGLTSVGEFLSEKNEYRYMASLRVEKGCLKCHEKQGYKEGDIRGGISVTYPVEEILEARDHAIITISLIHGVILLMGLFGFNAYHKNYKKAQQLRADKDVVEQANDLKAAFIANMSNKLRTPLNIIIGMSYVLSKGRLNPEQHENVEKISQAGNTLNNLINSMFNFASLDADKTKISATPMQFRNLLENIANTMREAAEKKGLTFSTQVSETVPEWLLGDVAHIREVLSHIVDNAIKFTQAGGVSITITAQQQDDELYKVLISVEDTGIGIKKEPHQLMKHGLSQIHQARSRQHGGVGIGLTLSRNLLERMGGCLEIESEAGKGTRVHIRLLLEATTGEGKAGQKAVGTISPAH